MASTTGLPPTDILAHFVRDASKPIWHLHLSPVKHKQRTRRNSLPYRNYTCSSYLTIGSLGHYSGLQSAVRRIAGLSFVDCLLSIYPHRHRFSCCDSSSSMGSGCLSGKLSGWEIGLEEYSCLNLDCRLPLT